MQHSTWLLACPLLALSACGGDELDDPSLGAEASALTSRSTVYPYEDADVRAQIVAAITSATTSINMIEFSYIAADAGVRPVSDALAAAAARGVRVRLLLDDGPSANAASATALRARGLDVRIDGPSIVTHNKAVCVDGRLLILGSTNMSSVSLTTNHEADARVRISAAAAAFDTYFESLWASPGAPATIPSSATATVRLLGDGQYAAVAKSTIDAATTTVDLLMYAATYAPSSRPNVRNALFDAMRAAHARGARVRVVFDQGTATSVTTGNRTAADYLTAGGVEVRWDPTTVITHAKLLVTESAAVVGSTNWTTSALTSYHATDLYVHRSDVAASYATYFDGVWAASTP